MLPKNRRIPKSYFSHVLKSGVRQNSQHILLYISPILTPLIPDQSRFSFSVSKKVSKRAVDRNKLRRRGYSIIKNNINNIKNGLFFFFSFKKGSNDLGYKVIESEVSLLLSNYVVTESVLK